MSRLLEPTVQDVAFTLRGWKRAPAFAVAAIATLGLGMGANAAIFSIVSGVLMRPLPFPQPNRLVQLSVSSPGDQRMPPTYVTAGDVETWRQRAASLESIATYSVSSQNLQGTDEPEQVATVRADRLLFATLGTAPSFGRTFDATDPSNVVVASYGFWQRRFNSDRSAVGREVLLDGQTFTLIGVMPPAFQFPYRATRTDLWTLWEPRVPPGGRLDTVVGRLKAGMTVDGARAELTGLSQQLMANRRANVTRVSDVVGGPVQRQLLVLLGAVGLVLLVACANVANLLLARAAGRSREVAVRIALGAGRWRIVRQFLTESLLLAAAGSVLGAAIAGWASHTLIALAGSQIPRAWDITFDWRVFLFLLLVCLLTGVGFGIAPAIGATRRPRDVQRDLPAGGRSVSARGRLRDALVVAEIALAFVLLVGAGLLLRTFLNLQATPRGFNADEAVTMHVVVADANESRAMEQRVAAIPGVTAAGFISLLPLQQSNWYGNVAVEGRGPDRPAEFRYVSPGYFAAMSIPIRRGRGFTDQDGADSPKVLIVNEAFARQFLPGEDPLGRNVVNRGVIVGVSQKVHQSSLDRPAVPELFYPVAQNFAQLRSAGSTLVVRSRVQTGSLVPAIRRAIREVNPNQATFRVQTLEAVVDESLGSQRLYLWLLSVFAAFGTALASAGVYGVMAYVVTLRTRELGIRMALGAGAGRVQRMVLGHGALLTGLGLAIGAAAAAGLTGVLKSVLFEVTTTDPITFGAIAILLTLVAFSACAIPARRAARIDPAVTLRAE